MITIVCIFSTICVIAQHTPSSTQNYIYVRTILKDNVKTEGDMQALTADDVRAEVQYFDGLGRPLQNVSVKAAPDGKDIITPIAYDAFGRQDKNYLPYAAAGTNGVYRPTAIADQASFYTAPPTASIPVIPNPYSQTIFEASPLDRPLEVGASGTPWAIGNGHTIKTDFQVNMANEVRLWKVDYNSTGNTGANSPKYYDAGQLYKNVTKDEQQNQVIEYKNKAGLVVCKKVQDGGTEQAPTFMITDYIYDDFNQLAYVVPPALESITSFTETAPDFLKYIYAYHYDGRRRLIEKKIPGKGWEYTVYNATDRPIFTSDAEQRNRGVWGFIKYDGLGRVILTGEVNDNQGRTSLQTAVNNAFIPIGTMSLYEQRDNNGPFGYTNTIYPIYSAGVVQVHSINYYDDYTIFTSVNPIPNTAYFHQADGSATESQRTHSLPTVTATNILGTPTYLYTATYYDEKGRTSKIVKQHQLNGVDIITNSYNFVGEVTTSVRQHYKDGNLSLTISNANQYDHAGRMTQTTETINSQTPSITTYAYNAIGQLETKTAGGQTINYAYNARGWIKKQSSNLFTQELKYDDAPAQYAQYNGNIAQQLWKTGSPTAPQHNYNYTYDKANRLLSGISDENYNETLGYDKMGNIQSLIRQGTTGIPGLGTLGYTYNGNQLQTVTGGYSRTYTYNLNGSMINDGQMSLQYNEINLPKQAITSAGTVTYTYDAAGVKLTKQTTTETRQYVDGIEYLNGTIDILQTEDGIARNSGGNYTYEYFLKDHLGNTRIVYNSSSTVLQQTDYYPFGLDILRNQSVPNKYLYNGKEKQDEMNQYDYGARFYDAVVGRWHVIDPLTDQYQSINPYNYVVNNPINCVDPNGKEWVQVNGNIWWDDRVTDDKTAVEFYGDDAKFRAIGYEFNNKTQGHIVLGEKGSFTMNDQVTTFALDATPEKVGDAIMNGGFETFISYFEILGKDYFFTAANTGFDDNATGLMAFLNNNEANGIGDAIRLSQMTHSWVDRGSGWTAEKNQLEHQIGMFLIAEKYGERQAWRIGSGNELRGLLINDRQNGNLINAILGRGNTAFEWVDLLHNAEGLRKWQDYRGVKDKKKSFWERFKEVDVSSLD